MIASRREFILALTGLLLCIASWSLASAPWSNDDFGYHVVNVWCVDGLEDGSCSRKSKVDDAYLIPTYYPSTCYFKNLVQPARCQAEKVNNEVKFSTLESNYQWLQMWMMHRFVGESGEISILKMRLFNGVLFISLVGLMLACTPRRIAKCGVIGISLALVPVGLWYVTSISPTGWTVIANSTGWSFAAALGRMTREGGGVSKLTLSKWTCVFGLMISSVIAFGSRKDGAVLFSVVVASALISESRSPSKHTRGHRLISSKSLLILVAVVVITALLRLVSFVSPFLNSDAPVFEASRRSEAVLWLSSWVLHYPYLFIAALGAEPMGSQELIKVPAIVWLITVLVLGRVVVSALLRPSIRQISSAIPLGLGLVGALWYAGQEFDYYNVPPRYLLPLLPAVVGLLLNSSRIKDESLGFSSRNRFIIVALGVGHALCLYVVLERYTAGYSGGLRSIPVRFDERWWNWPVGPNYVLMAGSFGWWMFLVHSLRFVESTTPTESVFKTSSAGRSESAA